MTEINKIITVVIVLGIFIVGLGLFIHPFVDTYSIDDPSLDRYDQLDTMLQQTSQYEEDLKGVDKNSSMLTLADFMASSAYTVFINGLTSIPVLGGIMVSVAEDLGVPAVVFTGLIAIVIVSVIISLALILLQVYSK